jgi:hypothetical protein
VSDNRLARLLSLKEAAEKIANSSSRTGILARHKLSESTGLSLAGVDLALSRCLEHDVSRSTLSALVKRTTPIQRSHVLLSANVFTATFRAIALSLIQSEKVSVRSSSREPVMATLLHEASGAAFEICEQLSPVGGEHFWAYGTDDTLDSLRNALPSGVHFHPHGAGMGAAVFVESKDSRQVGLAAAVEGLVMDTIVFDQRGCLSPRLVLIEGTRSFAEAVCELLVTGLKKWEGEVPLGSLSQEEEADRLRFCSTIRFVGSSSAAGKGIVFLDPVPERLLVPPIGRHLHVTTTTDAFALLHKISEKLTTVGFYNGELLPGRLQEAIGPRRYVELGQMQRPVFDGPVDLRPHSQVEIL